ncbi:protein ULTRAPETALA 2-like [Cynara cardunculus var. scolymus]|uniref:protein ULTRAPETALA 2-like n=1 Tax=Cynara cardunculus var. scolymus TaxID=59895 RepID=UPI000D62687F|nr:protein ULTRAPETALA 2-like [Cynara cardunculus var. scolymus]
MSIGAFILKLKSAAQKYRIPTLRSMAQELSLVLVPETIFTHEELRDYLSQIRVRAPHYIEIVCGCTSGKYGDSLGLLRISDDGTISAVCHCCKECKQVFDSPVEFVKHGSRTSNVPNWRKKVWILNQNGQKIKMIDTSFLKYYYGDNFRRPHNESGHRDQFLRCTACNKVRRFELRSRELCRFYHDAAASGNQTCFSMIPGRWTCEDLEERISSRSRTGCRKNIRCRGCVYCVCFGCRLCRFEDCTCRMCVDFYANVS